MRRNRISLRCRICNSAFEIRQYRERTAKFCSRACWKKRRPPNKIECPICHKVFETYQRAQKFCSRTCARKNTPGNARKHGSSVTRARARCARQLTEWRISVFRRDNYICQKCGATGVLLNAHHIQSFAKFVELRFTVSNGLTLCVACHGKEHGKDFTHRRNKICLVCLRKTSGRSPQGLCASCAITAWHRQRSVLELAPSEPPLP